MPKSEVANVYVPAFRAVRLVVTVGTSPLSAPEVPNATDVLDGWISAMHDARRAPLPFFPNAAEAYRASMVHNAKIELSPKSRAKPQLPIKKAAAAFTGNDFGAPGDESDPYLQLCFRDTLAFDASEAEFVRLATMLFEASWSPQMVAGAIP